MNMNMNKDINKNTKENKIIKEIDLLKAITKTSLSKNGESINLKIIYNNELLNVIRKVIIPEVMNFRLSTAHNYNPEDNPFSKTESRYKVKKVIYSVLNFDYRDCLFIKSFIDNGKYTFKFEDFNTLQNFLISFRKNLNELLKSYFTLEIEGSISFGLKIEKNN